MPAHKAPVRLDKTKQKQNKNAQQHNAEQPAVVRGNTAPRSRRLPADREGSPDLDGGDGGAGAEEEILEVPPSWCRRIEITQDEFDNRSLGGGKALGPSPPGHSPPPPPDRTIARRACLVIGSVAFGVNKLNCTAHGSRQPCVVRLSSACSVPRATEPVARPQSAQHVPPSPPSPLGSLPDFPRKSFEHTLL